MPPSPRHQIYSRIAHFGRAAAVRASAGHWFDSGCGSQGRDDFTVFQINPLNTLVKQRAVDETVISARKCRIQLMLIPMSGTTRVIIGVTGTTSNVRGAFLQRQSSERYFGTIFLNSSVVEHPLEHYWKFHYPNTSLSLVPDKMC